MYCEEAFHDLLRELRESSLPGEQLAVLEKWSLTLLEERKGAEQRLHERVKDAAEEHNRSCCWRDLPRDAQVLVCRYLHPPDIASWREASHHWHAGLNLAAITLTFQVLEYRSCSEWAGRVAHALETFPQVHQVRLMVSGPMDRRAVADLQERMDWVGGLRGIYSLELVDWHITHQPPELALPADLRELSISGRGVIPSLRLPTLGEDQVDYPLRSVSLTSSFGHLLSHLAPCGGLTSLDVSASPQLYENLPSWTNLVRLVLHRDSTAFEQQPLSPTTLLQLTLLKKLESLQLPVLRTRAGFHWSDVFTNQALTALTSLSAWSDQLTPSLLEILGTRLRLCHLELIFDDKPHSAHLNNIFGTISPKDWESIRNIPEVNLAFFGGVHMFDLRGLDVVTGLREMDFEDIDLLNVRQWLPQCVSLERLQFESSVGFGWHLETVQASMLSTLTNLRKLVVNLEPSRSPLPLHLSGCLEDLTGRWQALTHLKVRHQSALSLLELGHLGRCPKLRKLVADVLVTRTSQAEASVPLTPGDLPSLSLLTRLEVLDVNLSARGGAYVNEQGKNLISELLLCIPRPSLRTLKLVFNNLLYVPRDVLGTLFTSRYPSLEEFTLNGTHSNQLKLGDKSMEDLVGAMQGLRSLCLKWFTGVTDDGLGHLIHLCYLQQAELVLFPELTTSGLLSLAGCRALRKLEVSRLKCIEDHPRTVTTTLLKSLSEALGLEVV